MTTPKGSDINLLLNRGVKSLPDSVIQIKGWNDGDPLIHQTEFDSSSTTNQRQINSDVP